MIQFNPFIFDSLDVTTYIRQSIHPLDKRVIDRPTRIATSKPPPAVLLLLRQPPLPAPAPKQRRVARRGWAEPQVLVHRVANLPCGGSIDGIISMHSVNEWAMVGCIICLTWYASGEMSGRLSISTRVATQVSGRPAWSAMDTYQRI